jgi:hypothetical protein
MLGLSLKISLCISLLFAFAVGIIRVQPYDTAHIEDFFARPENCPVSCFMGISPGVTLIGEASAILRRRGWTQESLLHREVADFTELDTGQMYFVAPGERIKLYVKKNVVQVIEIIESSFQLGDVWLLLGRPDMVYGFVDSRGRVIRNLVYLEGRVSIGYVLPSCSTSIRELSQADTEVIWSSIKLNTIHPILSPSFYALRNCRAAS